MIDESTLPPEPILVPELAVIDIKRSLIFYQNIGFNILYQREEEGFAYLERSGSELMLDQLHKTRSWLTAEMTPPFGRGINLQIKVDNVEDLYQQVDADDVFLKLETQWYAGEGVKYGVKQFIVQDPDGYLLRLQESLETVTI